MYDVSAIGHYIEFLKKACGLSVSLHPMPEREKLLSAGELMVFNFHENSYCTAVKRNPKAFAHCLACQKKATEKCGDGAFSGVCFAGVKERVYPIKNGVSVTGFISVSGYRTENFSSYLARICARYGFDKEELSGAYGTLNDAFPEAAYLDTLLLPLCQMLELAYIKGDVETAEDSLTDRVIRYLRQNRNRDITSRDICREFYCSRSVMSTQFNRQTGVSIRDYINRLRIDDAKNLLKNSGLSVTEIATLVGFSNSNYFSGLFKKQMGMSPLQYRKVSQK